MDSPTIPVIGRDFFDRAKKKLTLDVPAALTDHAIAEFPRGDLDRDPAAWKQAGVTATRPAAVLVPVVDHAEPGVLLTMRTSDLPNHAGQIAFPGGREESGDPSLRETATRETREETGLDLAREGTVIGVLDDLRPRHIRLPAIVVRPYVAVVDRTEPLELSSEVALAFWIPFGALAHAESWREDTVVARGAQINARVFKHQDHIIWGMTERILAQLLDLV